MVGGGIFAVLGLSVELAKGGTAGSFHDSRCYRVYYFLSLTPDFLCHFPIVAEQLNLSTGDSEKTCLAEELITCFG